MNKTHSIPIVLHITIWAMLFLSPLTYLNHGNGVNLSMYLMSCMAPLMLMVVFYVNYLWLTTHYFIVGEKKKFFIFNVLMVLVLGIILHYWMQWSHDLFDQSDLNDTPSLSTRLAFIFRDILNLSVSATVATAIRLSLRWQQTEEERLAAVAAHTEAELRNLRSQINPHFLLNTLNNIYALTAFDSERAQQAIQQLSKLLRHMLYDNQQEKVNVENETQFLKNYVELMKIRLPKNIDVQFDIEYTSPDILIAPLLFISLVENAFKHGVSSTEHSYIHIKFTATEQEIVFSIINSNHPKSADDRSGHGIGLQQVQRRLDLTYPNQYSWEKGIIRNTNEYKSTIKIQL